MRSISTVWTAALLASLFAILCQAQTAEPATTSSTTLDPAGDAQERSELSQAVSEAGASSIDLIRALELHLKKYPDSKQRPLIEKAVAKSAIETNDSTRIILYGERVLQRESPPDPNELMQILDRVTRALVEEKNVDRATRALRYAERYERDVVAMRAKMEPPGHLTAGQWSEELDKTMARALALEARATGYSGDAEAAEKIATRSWEAYPTGEGARETGFWLTELKRDTEAVEFYADAFALEDPRTTEADRARDRERLGALYSKLNGSEKGLGDAMLAAWDRASALVSERRALLKAKDPNALATSIAEFTLPAIDKSTPPLVLSSLKGKTVVMDFWATWCAPCRAQQPLIEKVEKEFQAASDVLFVAVDSDDDPSLVAPFVKEQGWKHQGYFEAGLARQLTIASIPTVLIINPNGQISSRMIGFIPERFEQMLRERIEEARKLASAK